MQQEKPIQLIREEFIEKVGLIVQADGLPKIAGRVLGLLIFDGEVISFGNLAKQLQVSRGSISSSVRLLIDQGLIKRISKPGKRQDYFALANDPFINLLKLLTQRIDAARTEIMGSVEELPETHKDVQHRLEGFARFYEEMDQGLNNALTRLETTEKEMNR